MRTNPGKEKPMESEIPIDFSNFNLYPRLDRNTMRAPRHRYVITLADIPEEASSSLVKCHENATQQGISPNITISGSPKRKLFSSATNAVSCDSSPSLASGPRRSLARVKTCASHLQKHEEVKAYVSKTTARLRNFWAHDSKYRRCLEGRKRAEKAFQSSLDKLKSFRKEKAEIKVDFQMQEAV